MRQMQRGQVGHTMRFNNDGTLASLNNGQPIISEQLGAGTTPIDLNGADVTQTLNFSLDSSTQFAAPFELTKF